MGNYLAMITFTSNTLLIICWISSIFNLGIVSSDELCFVELEPNTIIVHKHKTSNVDIKCETYLNSQLSSNGIKFFNPVFDLTFGGEPRTGIYIIRGKAECNFQKSKCWSDFQVNANSVANLIKHNQSVSFKCHVADHLKHFYTNDGNVRCESVAKLMVAKELEFGHLCSILDANNVCEPHLKCDAYDSQYRCMCGEHYVPIRVAPHRVICAERAQIDSNCNYTEQCASLDENAVCRVKQNMDKVCVCDDNFEISHESNACKPRMHSRKQLIEMTTTDIASDMDNKRASLIDSGGQSVTNISKYSKHRELTVIIVGICFRNLMFAKNM